METNLLIAGIPANEWIGRRVRFWGHENKQHPTPCLVKGIDNKKVIILPIGHKQNELVDPSDIAPTWKNNDDLRQKYAAQLNGNMVEDPPEPDTPIVVTEVAESAPAPSVKPIALPRQPRMVIHRHDTEWQPVYQQYVESLKSEAADRHLLEEIHASIIASLHKQTSLINELKSLGVEIITDAEPSADDPAPTTEEASTEQPFKFNKGKYERLVGPRMTNELVRWGHTLRKRLDRGEEIEGTVNSLAAEVGTSWETLRSRFDVIEKRCRVKFTDDKGNHGRKVMGFLKVTAV